MVGLCYAELAACLPLSGSAYSYCRVALGNGCGWLLGWMLIFEYLLSASALAAGFAGYLESLLAQAGMVLPASLTSPLLRSAVVHGHLQLAMGHGIDLVAAFAAAVPAVLLAMGGAVSRRVNAVLVTIKLAVLLGFVAVGAMAIHPANWHPFVPASEGGFAYGWAGVARAASMLFFAYLGFETVSTAAAETHRPQRDVPLGVLGALAVCSVLYLLAAAVMTGVVPYRELGVADPVAVAVDRMGRPGFAVFIKIGALTGLGSVLLANGYGLSRICYAMARDRLLPDFFARLHPRAGSPWLGNLVLGALAAAGAALLPIGVLADMVCVGVVLAFCMVGVGLIWLRHTRPELPRHFRVPLGGVRVGGVWIGTVPSAAVLLSVAMALPVLADIAGQLRHGEWLPAGILAGYGLAGAAIYWAYGRPRAKRGHRDAEEHRA
jgi:APA family basic amino acid/polyamine antiporter